MRDFLSRLAWYAVALASVAMAHDQLSWAAQYGNANGTPCCVGGPQGDCVEVSASVVAGLGIGSTIRLAFPAGERNVIRAPCLQATTPVLDASGGTNTILRGL